nr:unnamed protein product [Callosobruchus analis]
MSSIVLHFATEVKLRCEGKMDASKVLKGLTQFPGRAKKYRKAFTESQNEQKRQLAPEEALSMFVEAGVIRKQYEIIRNTNNTYFPCYSILQQAKKDCYSVQEAYRITETCAEVNLQDVLNHTATRPLLSLQEIVQNLVEMDRNTLLLTCKWGCDGSHKKTF